GMTLVRHWRDAADPVATLEEAIAPLSWGLSVANPEESPRLTRDLFFTRARLYENLGYWSSDYYAAAERDYTAGLAVRGASHEMEARGRALTGLANTLGRIQHQDNAARDQRIIGLYEEALTCLSPDHNALNRSITLNSFAIYLNERIGE